MLDRVLTAPQALERLRRSALSTVLDDIAADLRQRGYSQAVVQSYLSSPGTSRTG